VVDAPVPQVEPPLPVEVDGGLRPVTPQPPQPPSPQVQQPQPPQPHTRPMPTRGRIRRVTPQPPRALEGDVVGVSVLPPDVTRRT
jgi:hypothetical protein